MIEATQKLMFHLLFVIDNQQCHGREVTLKYLKQFFADTKWGFGISPAYLMKLRKLNTYVDCKLVFSDGSLMVHFAKLLAAWIWRTSCRDGYNPQDDLVIIFPHQSIKYGLKYNQ